MNDETRAEITALLIQVTVLRDEINAMLARSHPMRLLLLPRMLAKLQRAQALLDRVNLLAGCPPAARPAPERWLGVGRTGWQCAQWGAGIWNAVLFWQYLLDGQRVLAALSLLIVFVTARWRLPRG